MSVNILIPWIFDDMYRCLAGVSMYACYTFFSDTWGLSIEQNYQIPAYTLELKVALHDSCIIFYDINNRCLRKTAFKILAPFGSQKCVKNI